MRQVRVVALPRAVGVCARRDYLSPKDGEHAHGRCMCAQLVTCVLFVVLLSININVDLARLLDGSSVDVLLSVVRK